MLRPTFKSATVALCALLGFGGADAMMVRDLKGGYRVLIVSAPSPSDRSLIRQKDILQQWRHGAADRDVRVVEIVGTKVNGAEDEASALRRTYNLRGAGFDLVLIGKDGHEAYRSAVPVAGTVLQSTIDAMPMRRAGQR